MPTLNDILGWKQSEHAVTLIHHVINPLTFFHSDIEHIWQTTWRIGFYRGGPVFMSAMAGIDIALWDLKGMSYCQNSSSDF